MATQSAGILGAGAAALAPRRFLTAREGASSLGILESELAGAARSGDLRWAEITDGGDLLFEARAIREWAISAGLDAPALRSDSSARPRRPARAATAPAPIASPARADAAAPVRVRGAHEPASTRMVRISGGVWMRVPTEPVPQPAPAPQPERPEEIIHVRTRTQAEVAPRAPLPGAAAQSVREGFWIRTCGIAAQGALVLSFLMAATVLSLTLAERVQGYESFAILSKSMTPNLPVGTLVVDHRVPAPQIHAGDVITFHPPGQPGEAVTHRVVGTELSLSTDGKQIQTFVTKGDANGIADPWRVPASGEIERVSYSVPRIGWAAIFLQTPLARLLLLVVPAVLLCVVLLVEIWTDDLEEEPRVHGVAGRERRFTLARR